MVLSVKHRAGIFPALMLFLALAVPSAGHAETAPVENPPAENAQALRLIGKDPAVSRKDPRAAMKKQGWDDEGSSPLSSASS